MKKTFIRILAATAAAAVAAAVPFMSGCASSHPEAVITISYDGTDYQLNYKLYRNMYPQTVQHFIELADAGFYNNTIIHDYGASYFYGGSYSYNAEGYESDYETDFEEGEGAMREYFENNSKEQEYLNLFNDGKLTPSVYLDYLGGYKDALPTVIGEVGETHVIQHGALQGGFGALRMFYSDKDLSDDSVDYSVYLDKDGNEDGSLIADYLQHSATSVFSVQTSTATGSTQYCIFGQLTDTPPLTDLISAVSSSTSLTVSNVEVDLLDHFVGGSNYDSYTLRSQPIVIKSVQITRR